MSIEKYGFAREMVCDICQSGFGTTYPADDFDIMIKDAKEAGWIIRKEDGWWEHFCDSCKSSVSSSHVRKAHE